MPKRLYNMFQANEIALDMVRRGRARRDQYSADLRARRLAQVRDNDQLRRQTNDQNNNMNDQRNDMTILEINNQEFSRNPNF